MKNKTNARPFAQRTLHAHNKINHVSFDSENNTDKLRIFSIKRAYPLAQGIKFAQSLVKVTATARDLFNGFLIQ